MPYEYVKYARRADADSIDLYSPSNFKMFCLKKVAADDVRMFGTNSLKYYLKIHSGGALELNAENSVLTLIDGGDITLTPSAGFHVKFGTRTATGDVACNGHHDIKDAAGNVVKLMTTA